MVEIPTVPLTDEVDEDRFSTLRVERLVSHHALILGALQDLADGVGPNLMLLMPPGSAKSTYVDVVFVPWFMARAPRKSVILASYGSDLARKQGRRARQLARSKSFNELFEARLSADSSAADEWSLTNGSDYMSGGLLSGITGNRADLGIIDDPVKGREEADSEAIRKRTREAYEDDFCTRLKPNGRQVIIQTRWNAADLAGSILPEDWSGESGEIDCRDGRRWRVICLPAVADRADDPLGRPIGHSLWPEWFPPDHWEPFKKNIRTWSALYQQKPVPGEGILFKRDWFNVVSAVPYTATTKVRAWDFAATDGDGDWTVGLKLSRAADGVFYIEDIVREQRGPAGVERLLKATADQDGIETRVRIPQDPAASGKVQVATYMKVLAGYTVVPVPVSGSKEQRAGPAAAQAEAGNVKLLRGNWNTAFLNEISAFPAGLHDDQVDAFADAINELALGEGVDLNTFIKAYG